MFCNRKAVSLGLQKHNAVGDYLFSSIICLICPSVLGQEDFTHTTPARMKPDRVRVRCRQRCQMCLEHVFQLNRGLYSAQVKWHSAKPWMLNVLCVSTLVRYKHILVWTDRLWGKPCFCVCYMWKEYFHLCFHICFFPSSETLYGCFLSITWHRGEFCVVHNYPTWILRSSIHARLHFKTVEPANVEPRCHLSNHLRSVGFKYAFKFARTEIFLQGVIDLHLLTLNII